MDCPVDRHEQILATLAQGQKDHEGRIRELEISAAKETEQIAAFYRMQGRIEEMIAEIKSQLEAIVNDNEAKLKEAIEAINRRIIPLEQADGKKWNALTGSIVTAIVVGIVGYMIGRLT